MMAPAVPGVLHSDSCQDDLAFVVSAHVVNSSPHPGLCMYGLSPVRGGEALAQVAQRVVDAPSLGALKATLDGTLNTLV